MFACWSRAASRTSRVKRSAEMPSSRSGATTLMTTLRPKRDLVGDEDARHAAAAELALDGVRVA